MTYIEAMGPQSLGDTGHTRHLMGLPQGKDCLALHFGSCALNP